MLMLLLKVMLTEFIAEMGDKTQLMLVALTSKFKTRDIILGTAIAILVLNGLAVLAGGLVGSLIPDWLIKLVAAIAFLYFAASSLAGEDDEEEDSSAKGNFKFAPLTVFCTFFVAELGDKTQLTAMTFGANEGIRNALIVWIGCSIGLFAADILGMLAGKLIQNKMPEGFLDKLAFAIFAVFGVLNVRIAMGIITENIAVVLGVTIAVAIVFAVICGIIVNKNSKQRITED